MMFLKEHKTLYFNTLKHKTNAVFEIKLTIQAKRASPSQQH